MMKVDFHYGYAFRSTARAFSLKRHAIPTGVDPALQSILKASSSYYGGTLIFLEFLLMSQPLSLRSDVLLSQGRPQLPSATLSQHDDRRMTYEI